MALKIGTLAPDFSLPSTSGRTFSLSRDVAGKICIIYFYPKDFTTVCTKEACLYSKNFDFFDDLDVPVYGISRDDIPTHLEFKKTYDLQFELLADVDGEVATLYDASMPLIKFTKRISYLIDRERKIVAVHQNLMGAQGHIKAMIDSLKAG